MLSAAPVAAPGRDRLIVWACIALITVLAWAYLLHLDREMSSSMAHDRMMAEMGMTMDMPRTPADLFFTFAMWAVMMIGMMAGPATPMLLLFAGMQRTRASGPVPMALPLFGLGYSGGLDRIQRVRGNRAGSAASRGPVVAGDGCVEPATRRRDTDSRRRLPVDAVQGRVPHALSQPAWISDEQLA